MACSGIFARFNVIGRSILVNVLKCSIRQSEDQEPEYVSQLRSPGTGKRVYDAAAPRVDYSVAVRIIL